MDTASIVAIICIVIALALLITMAIVTLRKAWKQVTRKGPQAGDNQTSLPHTFENEACNDTAHAQNDEITLEMKEHAQSPSHYGYKTELKTNSEASCERSDDKEANKETIVHVETDDTYL